MPSDPPPPASPHRKLWEEKDPIIAGILGYLIPGAGHLYQGRILKGIIYSSCILGLFFWGQKLGEGMVVNNTPSPGGAFILRYLALSYVAQLGAGAPALPALVQNARAESAQNVPVSRLTKPLSAEFVGLMSAFENGELNQLKGTIQLEPTEGQFGPEVRGTFNGMMNNQPVKLSLGGRFQLDRPIKAGSRRGLECDVIDDNGTMTHRSIVGSIPRPILDAYGSPPEPGQIQQLYEELGTIYDLALVFTWIAGLLNVLAVWDCVCGPAYGFGDEPATSTDQAGASGMAPATTSATPAAAASAGSSPPDPPRAESRPSQKTPV